MDKSTLMTITIVLGLMPLFSYVMFFHEKRDKHLKRHPFGGWYFLTELSIFFIVGHIPATALIVLFFTDPWPIRVNIIFMSFISVMAYFCFISTMWLRLSGYNYKTRLRDLKPFIREVMGKDSYPTTPKCSQKRTTPNWHFIGCISSTIIITITGLIFLWLWINA